MDIHTAQTIVAHVSNIAELGATFQAKFGRDYRLSETSNAEAWEIYRHLMAEQATIASLLEPASLENPYSRYGKWWERRDVIDSSLLNELSAEATTLVERCAYLIALGQSTVNAPSLLIVQQSIAGMLHPSTRHISLASETNPTQKAM